MICIILYHIIYIYSPSVKHSPKDGTIPQDLVALLDVTPVDAPAFFIAAFEDGRPASRGKVTMKK